MGGVVNTVSNLVGDAVDFVTSNADIALPIIAATVTGDPLLAADTFGSSTAADIAANEAASNLAGAGTIGDIFGSSSAGDIAANTYASDVANAAGETLQQLGVNTPTSLWDKFTGILSGTSGTSAGSIFDSLSKAAPLAGAGILGKLAYSDQARINDSITKAYNDYLSQQSGIRTGYGVTAGPQQLNYTMSGIPLARAPMRTAADVVNIPKKADGGILSKHSSNMLNEYMNLRNKLKKYKTGGRAHYAMGSSAMPMQQGMAPDKEKLKELFTKRPDILKKVLALKAQHESGQSSMG